MSDTHIATSTSLADVQTAVNAAGTGDTVVVPAGNSTWTTYLSLVSSKNLIMQGNGIGNTVLTTTAGMFTNYDVGYAQRWTGFEFREGFVWVDGPAFRVDHCKFYDSTYGDGIFAMGMTSGQHPMGVIDNCHLENCRVVIWGAPQANLNDQHALWHQASPLGTGNVVFIEDNVYTNTWMQFGNAVDANMGGRFVFRYNDVSDFHLECHSIQGTHRATRSWEIYDNTLRQVNYAMWTPGRARGGTGVFFNNTITGTFTEYVFKLDNVRTCQDLGAWHYCDGTSGADGNESGKEGYPCRDQIGRSTDQWLWTDVNPYPPQLLDPAYSWNNYYGATPVNFAPLGGCPREVLHIVENRDYYQNTAKPGYTPYAYPHPLREETVTYAGPFRMIFK